MPPDTQRSRYTMPILALVLLALAVGTWFIYQKNRNQQNTEVLSDQFMWTLTPVASAQGTTTDIKLRVAGVDVPVRSMPGTCVEIRGDNVKFLTDELSGVICKDASGTGSEIGIFKKGDGLVIKQGEVQGTERSNFVEIEQAQ